MLNINCFVQDLYQRNFLSHITSIFLLIGLSMSYQTVEAMPYKDLDVRRVMTPTVFENIQIDELLLTIIDEYKKVGFNYKKSMRNANIYGVLLEIDFDYLPKITNDDGDIVAKITIYSSRHGNGELFFQMSTYGVSFSKTLVLKNEEDLTARRKASENFELGLINIKEKLKKFLVPSSNK